MTTIHSSSLSFQPAGYVKPERTAIQPRSTVSPIVDATADNQDPQSKPASTPEQIQTAIEQSGLDNENTYPQADNARIAKALANYSQTRKQSAQSQLSSLISGIDLYA